MAHGSLSGPRGSAALEVAAPGPAAALALVGAARRLGVDAKSKQVRGVDQVVVRDNHAIEALLRQLGAAQGVLAWQDRQLRRQERAAAAGTIASHDTANQRRSAYAAAAAVARVQRRWRCWRVTPQSICLGRGGCGWSIRRSRWKSSALSSTRR